MYSIVPSLSGAHNIHILIPHSELTYVCQE